MTFSTSKTPLLTSLCPKGSTHRRIRNKILCFSALQSLAWLRTRGEVTAYKATLKTSTPFCMCSKVNADVCLSLAQQKEHHLAFFNAVLRRCRNTLKAASSTAGTLVHSCFNQPRSPWILFPACRVFILGGKVQLFNCYFLIFPWLLASLSTSPAGLPP